MNAGGGYYDLNCNQEIKSIADRSINNSSMKIQNVSNIRKTHP